MYKYIDAPRTKHKSEWFLVFFFILSAGLAIPLGALILCPVGMEFEWLRRTGNARIRGKKDGRSEGEMRLCNWFRMYKYVAEYRTTKR